MTILCDNNDVIMAITQGDITEIEENYYQITKYWSVLASHKYIVENIPKEIVTMKYCYNGINFTTNPNYVELEEQEIESTQNIEYFNEVVENMINRI